MAAVSTAAANEDPDDVRPEVLSDAVTDRAVTEPAGEPTPPEAVDAARAVTVGRRGPARMPVPPLLVDLAGWGWRLLLLSGIAWLLLRVAQRLSLVSLPLAAALLMTALLSPVVSALRRRRVPRGVATAITV